MRINALLWAVLVSALGCGGGYRTVGEIIEQVDTLMGQRVRVRGWAQVGLSSTLLWCKPEPGCCNGVGGSLALTAERMSLGWREPGIAVPQARCAGNECYLNCGAFDPWSAPSYELIGVVRRATPSDYSDFPLILDELDLGASRQLTGDGSLDELQEAPITAGLFRVKTPKIF